MNFFITYVAATWLAMGHCQGDSHTHQMVITTFYFADFYPKVTSSLAIRVSYPSEKNPHFTQAITFYHMPSLAQPSLADTSTPA